MSGTTGARLSVDLGALTANTQAFVRHTGVDVMAVVKAGGFGLGDVAAARAALAGGATWLGVTGIAEALALRLAGITEPILSWLNPVDADVSVALAAGVDLAVPSLEHLDAVLRAAGDLTWAAGRGTTEAAGRGTTGAAGSASTEAARGWGSPQRPDRRHAPRPGWSRPTATQPHPCPLGAPARVHLYLDCGMARDGAPWRDWPALVARAARAQRAGLLRVVGVMGHLSCADDPAHPANREARARFARGVRLVRAAGLSPEHRHLAATAGALADPLARHTMVRIGAGLYGIDYGLGSCLQAGRPALRGAATLTAPVVAVRDVAAGTPVGYGATWHASAATRLALLPLGYADGLPRAASNRAEVLLLGRRCPVVGRISMDQTVVDVGDLPVRPGDVATVFGPGAAGEPTVREWAGWADTIEHEVLTGIGPRVRRSIDATAPDHALTCATAAPTGAHHAAVPTGTNPAPAVRTPLTVAPVPEEALRCS